MRSFPLMPSRIGILPAATTLALAACSPGKAPQPTEQNLHAEEVGQPGRVDHHLFRCDHGRTLLVDFENEGLTLSIRDKPAAPPLRLTAPAQGELFVGKGGSAAMKDQALQLEMADGTRRTCVRANKG